MKTTRFSLLAGFLTLLVGSFFYVIVFTPGEHMEEPNPKLIAEIPTPDVGGGGNVDGRIEAEPQSENHSVSENTSKESNNEIGEFATTTGLETPVSSETRSIEELAGDFKSAVSQYTDKLETASRSSRSPTPTFAELAEIDEVFQQLLKSYLASDRTHLDVRRELSALVGWVEVPMGLGLGDRAKVSLDLPGYETEALKGEYDAKPLVLWRDVPRKEGGAMMVCQGSYVVANSAKRFRVRMRPYSVFEFQGSVQVTYLCGDDIGPWYPGNSGLFVDAFDIEKAMPVVGLLAGPSGNAGGLRLYINSFDPEKRAWVLWDGDEWDDVSAWDYSATSKILTVYGYDSSIGDYYEAVLNVANRVARRSELNMN